jgi:penicillin-binding protein 2
VVEGSSRVYTYAPLASQIIGYLGAIPAKQAKDYRSRGYQPSDRVGIAGIEQSFEDQLRGQPGKRVFEVDARNRITRVVEDVPPTPGNDVKLTIDMQVQQYAEMILGEALRERRTEITTDVTQYGEQEAYYSAPTGSVVVEDPTNGRIIAMASYPTFDNRWFTQPLPQSTFDALFKTNDPEKAVLVNRAITGRYQLGSTMKMISATAGLLYDQLPAGAFAKFMDDGEFVPSNCDAKKDPKGCGPKHNAAGVHYGNITLPQALAVSSDVYFYNVGERLWLNTDKGTLALQTVARNYGLGTESEIDLPNEYAGIVPDKDVKKRLGEQSNYKAISRQEASDYFTGDNVQLAIGQGLLTATPLQLANAYATFANGGTRYRPLIADTVVAPGATKNPDGTIDMTKATVIDSMAPVAKATVTLAPDQRRAVLEGLEQVITGPIANGHLPTAYGLFNYVPGFDYKAFPIAGKTGTAQDNTKLGSHDTSLFAAFGPVDAPQYVVAAVLEKAGYGSEAAAPVTKCMFEALSGQTPLPDLSEPDPLDRSKIKPVEIAAPPDTSCLKIWVNPNSPNKVD